MKKGRQSAEVILIQLWQAAEKLWNAGGAMEDRRFSAA